MSGFLLDGVDALDRVINRKARLARIEQSAPKAADALSVLSQAKREAEKRQAANRAYTLHETQVQMMEVGTTTTCQLPVKDASSSLQFTPKALIADEVLRVLDEVDGEVQSLLKRVDEMAETNPGGLLTEDELGNDLVDLALQERGSARRRKLLLENVLEQARRAEEARAAAEAAAAASRDAATPLYTRASPHPLGGTSSSPGAAPAATPNSNPPARAPSPGVVARAATAQGAPPQLEPTPPPLPYLAASPSFRAAGRATASDSGIVAASPTPGAPRKGGAAPTPLTVGSFMGRPISPSPLALTLPGPARAQSGPLKSPGAPAAAAAAPDGDSPLNPAAASRMRPARTSLSGAGEGFAVAPPSPGLARGAPPAAAAALSPSRRPGSVLGGAASAFAPAGVHPFDALLRSGDAEADRPNNALLRRGATSPALAAEGSPSPPARRLPQVGRALSSALGARARHSSSGVPDGATAITSAAAATSPFPSLGGSLNGGLLPWTSSMAAYAGSPGRPGTTTSVLRTSLHAPVPATLVASERVGAYVQFLHGASSSPSLPGPMGSAAAAPLAPWPSGPLAAGAGGAAAKGPLGQRYRAVALSADSPGGATGSSVMPALSEGGRLGTAGGAGTFVPQGARSLSRRFLSSNGGSAVSAGAAAAALAAEGGA